MERFSKEETSAEQSHLKGHLRAHPKNFDHLEKTIHTSPPTSSTGMFYDLTVQWDAMHRKWNYCNMLLLHGRVCHPYGKHCRPLPAKILQVITATGNSTRSSAKKTPGKSISANHRTSAACILPQTAPQNNLCHCYFAFTPVNYTQKFAVFLAPNWKILAICSFN